MFNLVKRLFLGRPLRSEQHGETLLPKWLALPVFASDPISSVAYATEQILLALALGGAACLALTPGIAVAIGVVLVVVIASYRQTCHAYPSGGGAFVVARDNLGEGAALTAAAALLVDYVMTVAVSVVAGVSAITSAFRSLAPHAAAISASLVLVIALVNLRGVRESGKAFAVPTYAFIGLTFLMLGVGAVRAAVGDLPLAETAGLSVEQTTQVGGVLTVALALRAFASGCTALTGVEAISNGVPAFRRPSARNAATTLTIMGALAVTMFAGVTVLAVHLDARAVPNGNPTVISQVAASVFGDSSALYYAFQAATAGILILAANTAFNGFPGLCSILAQNGYLPHQLKNRGDRLVFSNGIVILAMAAITLIIGFRGNLDRLIQLYIIGVFTSFTLSQFGMVRHWSRAPAGARRRGKQALNLLGGITTLLVLVIVFITKVTHGAWLAVAAMVLLFVLMHGISRYYRRVETEITALGGPSTVPIKPPRIHAVVLVSRLHKPALRALAFAKATRPDTLEAVTPAAERDDIRELQREWERRDLGVPLRVLYSPYRDVARPIVEYVEQLRWADPRGVVSVFVPEYVVPRWWQNLLHNQSALRLKGRLLFSRGVVVVNVPYHVDTPPRSRRPGVGRAQPATPAPRALGLRDRGGSGLSSAGTSSGGCPGPRHAGWP